MSKERELLKKAIQIIETLGPDEEAYEFINEILLLEPEQEPVGIVRTIGGYPDESDHIAEWTCSFKYLKDGDKLYLAPPKREPIDLDQVDKHLKICDLSEDYRNGYSDGIVFAEIEHWMRGII